jgi:hypothetical protein
MGGERAQTWAWVAGAGALATAAALVWAVAQGGAAWRGWLAAAVLAVSAPAGAAALGLMIRLIPGGWRGPFEAPVAGLCRLWPLGVMALLPVLAAAGAIYPWAGEPQPGAFRGAYLSTPFFIVRGLVWLALVAGLAELVVRRAGGAAAASVGLIAFTLLGSMAAVDLLMSLDPRFNSSGFGLYVLCLQMTFALSLAILVPAGAGGLQAPGTLGAVLLTALLLWTYFAFMQHVIVWSGDLPSGADWYLTRGRRGWRALIWAVAATRLVPLAVLLFPRARGDLRVLRGLAWAVVIGTPGEVAWLALPSRLDPAGLPDLAAFGLALAGMAALMVGLYGRLGRLTTREQAA